MREITRTYENTARTASGGDELIVELNKKLIEITENYVITKVTVNVEYQLPGPEVVPLTRNIPRLPEKDRIEHSDMQSWLITALGLMKLVSDPVVPSPYWSEFLMAFDYAHRHSRLKPIPDGQIVATVERINEVLQVYAVPFRVGEYYDDNGGMEVPTFSGYWIKGFEDFCKRKEED